MRRPFVLRVQADDPGTAKAIARALMAPLCERGARVMLNGQAQGGGSEFGVHVMTGDRGGVPGVALRIGVWDEEEGARWLAPLEVPSDPALAAERALNFLERWGFIGGVRAPAATRPSHT